MDIYFSCSLTGGRTDQPIYEGMVAHLQACGHHVLTAHLASPLALEEDADQAPEAVFERDTAWVRACSVLIADVSTPSHGVGFEVAYALERGKPVLCLARQGVRVSKMISGIRRPGFAFHTYRNLEEACALMETCLAEPEPRA
jgi:nucleoside 2-deoxyribosyltransferase